MTWDEFAKWANFSEQQREVLGTMKKAEIEAIEVMKDMRKRFLIDYDKNILEHLSDKFVKAFVKTNPNFPKATAELNKMINSDPKLKETLADFIVEDIYKDWGKYHDWANYHFINYSAFIREGKLNQLI